MRPLVSIIIPVHGTERFLQDCIDSLVSQTIKETELIFVNDASPDNCLKILYENKRRYPELITVIDSKENISQGGARNLGLKAAKGKYIGFCDSDDMVAPKMYESLYEKIEADSADVVFIQYASIGENTSYRDVTGDCLGKKWKPCFEWDECVLEQEEHPGDIDAEALLTHPIGGVVCGLWKKELLDQTGVSFPERIKYEDNYWGNIVTVYIRKIAFIEEILYFYRMNSNSTTHTVKYSYDRILIERSLLQEVKRRGLFEKYHDGWEYIFITRYAWTTSCMLCSAKQMTDFKAVRAIYRDLWREFPMWWKNHYYVKSQGVKRKAAQFLMAVFPSVAGYLLHNYLKIRQYTIKKAGDKSDTTVT